MEGAGSGCSHVARLAGAEPPSGDLWANKESLTCFDCGCPGPNLWICLQPDCHHIGCSEVKNDHSTIHQKSVPTHCVHMNVSTERIWCYACEREVHIRAVFSPTKMQILPETSSIGGASGVARLGFDRSVGLNVSLVNDDEEYVDEPQYGEGDTDWRPKGLVGLQNMGNTCYMNAALQALSNTRPFTDYFLDCAPAVMVLAQNKKPALSRAYQKLVTEMWNKNTRGYVVPNGILYGVRNVHPMFRGYHQHDTQEFLRCFLDRLHEELKEPVRDCNDQQGADAEGDHRESARKQGVIRQRAASSGANEAPNFFPVRRRSPAHSTFSESRADGYLRYYHGRCSEELASPYTSRPSPSHSSYVVDTKALRTHRFSRVHALSESEGQERGAGRHRRSASFAGMQHSQQYSHVPVPDSSRDVGSESDLSCESEAEERYETCSSGGASDGPDSRPEPRDKQKEPSCGSGDGAGVRYRSVISDVFDGKLLSSVQCLICDRVSTRVETFQDLSLPIPSRDHIAVLRSQQPPAHPPGQIAQDSWVWWLLSWFRSWFYGPAVSLQDCLAAFFSADELKGDNMYSCSRCNKLRNGVKMSGVVRLPEVLCVHLKRFRHELMFSAKVGARVSFPLQDLNMAPYTPKECTSKISRYELCAVICHAGTAGGGHYTCVARNGRSWYEFDDQCVTQVPRQAVAGAEAYVLFYKKVNPQMETLRQRASEILQAAGGEPNDMKFYISKQWINKFNTWAEPGAIDNSDFVCSHGGVRPDRAEHVHHLAAVVPQALWEYLHDKFGGGPACTHVHECGECARAAERLRTRRARELRAFYDLHATFQEQENPRVIYAISMHWFRQWQAFVRNKTQQPPPPVDNSGIVSKQDAPDSTSGPVYILKQGSDHAQLSEELWRFFTDIYGGGPEVKLKSLNPQPEPMYPTSRSQDAHRERLPSLEAKRPTRKHSESDKEDQCNKATSEVNINNICDGSTLNKNTHSLQNIDRRYRVNSSRVSGDSDDEVRYTRNRIRRVSHRERNGNCDSDDDMNTSPLRMNGVDAPRDANDNPLQSRIPHVSVTMETEELPNVDSISLKGKVSGKVRRVKKRTVK